MQLTKAYSRVAVFDTTVDFEKTIIPYSGEKYNFTIDGAKYNMSIYLRRDREFGVDFSFYGIDAVGEEKEKILNKLPEHHRRLYKDRSEYSSYDILNVGNAYKVMSMVISIIKKFVETHNVDSLYFSSYDLSRTKLYRAIVRRLVPEDQITVNRENNSAYFYVKLKGKTDEAN